MKLKQDLRTLMALTGIVGLGLAGVCNTAQAASATGNASATIVTAIAISETASASMNFGKIDAGATGGTVVLSPSGTVTPTGVTALTGSGAAADSFDVSGAASTAYTVTLPAAAVTLSDGAGHSMSVDTFTSTSASGTNTLSASGTDTLNVGATLHVGASQVAGTYTGTYTVSVVYQ